MGLSLVTSLYLDENNYRQSSTVTSRSNSGSKKCLSPIKGHTIHLNIDLLTNVLMCIYPALVCTYALRARVPMRQYLSLEI